MRKYFSILLVSVYCCINAQFQPKDFTTYYLLNLGYTYQGINYFEGGGNIYFVQPNNNIIDIGATVNLSYIKDKVIPIPEIQMGYLFNSKGSMIDPYSKEINSAFWAVRTSISPWHITPEIGITILSLIDITTGYGFSFREHKNVMLDGFKIGVSMRFPFLLLE